MEIVEIVERLGSFGLLAALIWYMASKMLPRTMEIYSDRLRENTAAVQEGRRENSDAHRRLAELIDQVSRRMETQRVADDARAERILALLERVLDRVQSNQSGSIPNA